MVSKRKNRIRVRTLPKGKLDAPHARDVRAGYIGETEKTRGASPGLPCNGSSKDPAY